MHGCRNPTGVRLAKIRHLDWIILNDICTADGSRVKAASYLNIEPLLVPLVKTEPTKSKTFVIIEPADRKFESLHCL